MLLIFAVVGCIVSSFSATGQRVYTERDLKRHLFSDYDKLVRPVKVPTNTITVSTGISPLAIKTLDDKEQVLVLDSFILMKWRDDYLQWDPEEFSSITELRLPHELIWKPDLSLYTASPVENIFPKTDTQVIVYNNGTVFWVPPFTIHSRCPLSKSTEKSYVECNIRIGSWTYSGPLLNPQLINPEVELRDFQDINPHWKLVTVKSSRESKFYPCCVEEYPLLHFNVTLKRRWPEQVLNKQL